MALTKAKGVVWNSNDNDLIGNVRDYGAVGDGVTDDTAAVNSCISQTGGAYFPSGTYLLSSLSLSKAVTLKGESRDSVRLIPTTSSTQLTFITITSSKCSIFDLTVDLLNTDNTIANGFINGRIAIDCQGTSSSYISDITIRNCAVKNCGDIGIQLQWVQDSLLSDIYINRCGKFGFQILSSRRIKVHNPTIIDIFPGDGGNAPYLNAYGLAFTNYTNNAVCEDCEVVNGYAEDITSWEGFDTHRGRRIRFINCSTKNCGQGIIVESNTAGSESSDITILGGTHIGYGQSYTRDGATFDTQPAVVANMGSSSANGTGLLVSGLVIYNMGSGRDSSDAAIQVQNCDRYVVTNNVITNSYKRGIVTLNDCINGVISNNTINTVTTVGGISYGINTSNETTCNISGNYVSGTVNQPYQIRSPLSGFSVKFSEDNMETITNNVQQITGPGAISIDPYYYIVQITTTGAQAFTLADGFEGQEKRLVMVADGGTGTVTPTNFSAGTSLTFDAVGDTAHLVFTNGSWHLIGGTATVV